MSRIRRFLNTTQSQTTSSLTKSKRRRQQSRDSCSRRLRMESLENRRVLAGVVTVDFDDTSGLLTLTGDINSNHVVVSESASQPGDSFDLKGMDNTRLALDTIFGRTELEELTLTNVKDITVDFTSGGSDTFEMSAASNGDQSDLQGRLDILFGGASEAMISDSTIERLSIDQVTAARAEWTLDNVNVVRRTDLTSAGGETIHKITDSELDGVVRIINQEGEDQLQIVCTTFGAGINVPGPPDQGYLNNALIINNGDGRSMIDISSTTDTGDSTVVHGGVKINNGEGFDTILFAGVETRGGVVISNGDGDAAGGAMVIIDQASVIGSDQIDGSGLVLTNGTRRDMLSITDSSLPNGMLVDNSVSDDAGNDLGISGATIGGNPLYGTALQVINGRGNDNMTIASSTLNGLVDLGLAAGNDDVNISDTTVNGVLNIGNTGFVAVIGARFTDDLPGFAEADATAGLGRDTVVLDNVSVLGGTFIALGQDSDTLELLGSTKLKTIGTIDGGDSFGDALKTEVGVEIHQTLEGFETIETVVAGSPTP